MEEKMNRPSIDHSFLSPSGKRSKRASKQYMDKFAKELFPEGMDFALKATVKQPTEKERLLNQAKTLQDLADAGMNTQKYTKEAAKLRFRAFNCCPFCGKEKSSPAVICICEVDTAGMEEWG
jgi:hypothetical protein